MANDKNFKVKNGLSAKRYLGTNGTITSGVSAYDLDGFTYSNVSFDVSSYETVPNSVFFKPDGTMFFITGQSSDAVTPFTMSTAWDLSTATVGTEFSVANESTSPGGLWFKSDGTAMYIAEIGLDVVYQYALSTAWDVSTASYDSKSFSVTGQTTLLHSVSFKDDGTVMLIAEQLNDSIYAYDLSTAWDVSTATYNSVSLDVSSHFSSPREAFFADSGNILFVAGVGFGTSIVQKYTLSTAYDISSATLDGRLDVTNTNANGAHIKPDGTRLYIIEQNNDTIKEYSAPVTKSLDLSTGTTFDLSPTSDVVVSLSNPAPSGTVSTATLLLEGGATTTYDIANASYDSKSFSVTSQDGTPENIFFKPDGLKMYLIGRANDAVYQYTLSTAWDVSTASYDSVSFSVNGQETNALGLFFKHDGTKMYVIGSTGDDVNEYDLSTAWDISSASYLQVFSVSAQETTPYGLFFKSDGLKMYIVGTANGTVYQYTLSTAWDVSTASYDSVSFSATSQDTAPRDVWFSDDGSNMFILGGTNSAVYKYTLSTSWDVSTASYYSVSFSFAAQDTSTGFFFGSSGEKLYINGNSTDIIYQYSTATPATITYDSSIKWELNQAPTSPALGEKDAYVFLTTDGGTTYYGKRAGDAVS